MGILKACLLVCAACAGCIARGPIDCVQVDDGDIDTQLCGNGTCDTAEDCTSCPTDCGACSTAGVFHQDPASDHIASMEAEHYLENIVCGSNEFALDQSVGNYSGDGWMRAPAEGDTTCELNYTVHFVVAGTHYAWLRLYGENSGENGGWISIDDGAAEPFYTDTYNEAFWDVVTLAVPSTSEHSVRVRWREPSVRIDKIVLVPGSDYTPTGLGPEETL